MALRQPRKPEIVVEIFETNLELLSFALTQEVSSI
jgi:hypothetical protein